MIAEIRYLYDILDGTQRVSPGIHLVGRGSVSVVVEERIAETLGDLVANSLPNKIGRESRVESHSLQVRVLSAVATGLFRWVPFRVLQYFFRRDLKHVDAE